MAMRFTAGLSDIISKLDNPAALKTTVSSLGFQHLDLDVTVPRVALFRDAILDLLQVEVDQLMTSEVRVGFARMLNYAGGAYIHVCEKFADRIKTIQTSWATANNRKLDLDDLNQEPEDE